MSEDEFWAIIEKSKHASSQDGTPSGNRLEFRGESFAIEPGTPKSLRNQYHALFKTLILLSINEIGEFVFHWQVASGRADERKLQAICYLCIGVRSDSVFVEFKDWLISRGRGDFQKAIQEPDSVSILLNEENEYTPLAPGLGYLAIWIYETKSGSEILDRYIPPMQDFCPDDPVIHENQFKKIFPKTWEIHKDDWE